MARTCGAFLGATSLFVLAAALGGPAFAQDAATEDEEIVVTGYRSSLRDAIEVRRNSALVVDVIAADDIGQLPDVTIAESLVRLPGINGSRDRGNESQASIRGLGPRLVLGLVNGREVASSEPGRNIRWEIYPSEVVGGVEVYKSQSANLIAGGVAGTVDIRTQRPLDHEGPAFVVRGGPVYYVNENEFPDYDPLGWRASGSVTHRISDDLAFNLGLSFQRQKNAFASFQGWGYNDVANHPGDMTGDLNGDTIPDPTPWGMQTEVKGLTEDRTGVSAGLQWRPSSNFQLNFDALYSLVAIDENQNQAWYGRNGVTGNWANGSAGCYNGAGSSYTIESGSVVAATLNNCFTSVTNVIARYVEDKDLFVTGLNGQLTAGQWDFTGDLSYSEATRENQWRAIFTEVYPNSLSFDTRAGILPFVTTSANPADVNSQFLPSYVPGQSDGPEHVTDQLAAVSLSAERSLTGFFESVGGGVRYSDRSKDHDRRTWSQLPIIGSLPANLLSNFQVRDFTAPPLLTGDWGQLAQLAYGGFIEPSNAEDIASRYSVAESVLEAFVMGEFETDAFSGNVGVRFIQVETQSDGFESINSGTLTPVSVSHEYSEVLPSLNLTFPIGDDQQFRLGLARTIARPPLEELRAGRSLFNTTPPPTGTAGNPELDPFVANQIDVAFEWYFAEEALAAVSLFYKDVESNIGYSVEPVTFNSIIYNVTGPFNGPGGGISGQEILFQTPFYFLPGLENFGVYFNYAHVDTGIEELYPAPNPLPAGGFAEHTLTLDLWFNNGPFEARVGYKYHSPFTIIYGWDAREPQTLEEESIWDASASYQLNDHIGLRLQVNNITNEPLRTHRDNNEDRLGRYDVYGRRVLFDISYRY